MLIVEGREYQITGVCGVVSFCLAHKDKRAFEGSSVFRCGSYSFAESGKQVSLNLKKGQWEIVVDVLATITEVNEDVRRRREAFRLLCEMKSNTDNMFGKVSDVFMTGTASDELIAQAEQAHKEVARLLEMLRATVPAQG